MATKIVYIFFFLIFFQFESKSNEQVKILETSALIQIKDIKNPSKDRVFLFNNWMFATNAAINAIEHPNYDITLKNCG